MTYPLYYPSSEIPEAKARYLDFDQQTRYVEAKKSGDKETLKKIERKIFLLRQK